jgi:hypothetical protein
MARGAGPTPAPSSFSSALPARREQRKTEKSYLLKEKMRGYFAQSIGTGGTNDEEISIGLSSLNEDWIAQRISTT